MNILLLSILLLAAGPEMEVLPLQGTSVTGNLVELTAERATVEAAGQKVSFDTAKLMAISPKQKPAAAGPAGPVWVEMIDGSQFAARDYTAADRKAKITLSDTEVLDVPVRDIATVRLQASSESLNSQWTRIIGQKTDSDLMVVRKTDSLDYHKGTTGDVTASTVNFDMEGDKIPVKRPSVFGLFYHHAAGRELPEAVCQINDSSGARWMVRSLELSDALQLTTSTGLVVKRPLEMLTHLDFSRGKIVYLSDMKPDSTRFTSFFSTDKELPILAEFFAPRQDKNLEGKPLQLDGKQYSKGLALHSRTEIVYRLPGKFSRLKATAGIDDAVRPNGNVRLVIRGDDKILLEETVAGASPAKLLDVDLDLTGVRRLGILVDFGDDMDVADHLDLCNARIIK
jgi:hypothetical protein